MSLAILVKPEARTDVATAARWYRDLNPDLAGRFLIAVGAAVTDAATHPTAHPLVDVDTGTRRSRVRGFPYRVFYLVELTRVVIIAIAHDKRDHRIWHERLD